jgi:hypothetical protein
MSTHVANDEPGRDRFHQDDQPETSACDPSVEGTYLTTCIHGGEFRKVVAVEASSCDGLQLTEELELFRWRCHEEPEDGVVFYSDGFNPSNATR